MKITTSSPQGTLQLGSTIAKKVKKGDIICLFGGLGSGKTVLVKGIAQGLGINCQEVLSPTFVLIRQYKGREALNHFDLYRLDDVAEIVALGYEEYFYDEAVCVIEWAERLKQIMPKECLKIELSFQGETQRVFSFTSLGERYRELLIEIKKTLHNKKTL